MIAGRGLEEVSIGDYVLSGGEIAALVVLDACVRLLPGVMGKAESGVEESFEGGLLEYPHYTRPRDWEGHAIPEVLSGGNHGAIARWRRAEAERITAERRPDLPGAAAALRSGGLQVDHRTVEVVIQRDRDAAAAAPAAGAGSEARRGPLTPQ